MKYPNVKNRLPKSARSWTHNKNNQIVSTNAGSFDIPPVFIPPVEGYLVTKEIIQAQPEIDGLIIASYVQFLKARATCNIHQTLGNIEVHLKDDYPVVIGFMQTSIVYYYLVPSPPDNLSL